MLLHWRANLADQNKQQPLKINIRVTYQYRPLSMKQIFDRHMLTLFEKPSQSDAAFAGERRFSKSRGLSASVSFLPLPLPPLSVFGSCFISRAAKTEIPFLSLSLLRNQTETLAKQARVS